MVPYSVLLKRFEDKAKDLRTALNDPKVQGAAVDLVQNFLEWITINSDDGHGAHAEKVAKTVKLLAFANEKGPPLLH